MRYKALMLDVDGTLIPYEYQALPSLEVIKAIKQAQELLSVCLVTGRSLGFLSNILESLELDNGFAVVNNGAQVVNLANYNLLYDKPIEKRDAKKIIDILFQEKIPFYLKQDLLDLSYQKKPFAKEDSFKNAYMIFTDEVLSEKKVEDILNKLSNIPKITLHKSRHKYPDKFGINISHAEATKMHGIFILAKELKIEKREIIGVGDSYNDFPLLMACGLKVAMGNAIDDLKKIADYIAPPVDHDGVVDVIEKFIFKK